MSYDEIISQLEDLKGHCVDMSKGDCERMDGDLVDRMINASEAMALASMNKSITIYDSFLKADYIINHKGYKNVFCSISGGSDSDIMLDLIYRVDFYKKVKYVWFDTGLEYQATKEHLDYLEKRYGIKIHRYKAIKPIPLSCRQDGQPFMSKRVSELISRLQRHGFDFKDESYDVLVQKYPKCKAALRWWCNDFGDGSRFNIDYNKHLKEFMVENPPAFKISNKCCNYAKKDVAKKLMKDFDIDLNIYGVRKAEGGIRSSAYKNCFTNNQENEGVDEFRPIFWYKQEDKECYEKLFNIKYSDCYEKYGMLRTGCAGCPYGKKIEEELDIIKRFEPKLFTAVNNIFKDSYEYTDMYNKFKKSKEV